MAPSSVVCEDNGEDLLRIILAKRGLHDSQEFMDQIAGKRVVLLLGETGAGKSTLGNAMVDGPGSMVEVVKHRDGYRQVLYPGDDDDGEICLMPKIALEKPGTELFAVGAGAEKAVTKYPKAVPLRGDVVLCDLPGFADPSGSKEDLINALNIRSLFLKAGSIKLCFFIPELAMQQGDRLNKLKKILEVLKGFLKDSDTYNRNISNVQLVITLPKGALTKKSICEKLAITLRSELKVDDAVVDAILGNVMFVDAADRTYLFRDKKHSLLGGHVSQSQDTVASFVDAVCRAQGWISPHDFNTFLAQDTRVKLVEGLHAWREKADVILRENRLDFYQIFTILNNLKTIDSYELPGLDVKQSILQVEEAFAAAERREQKIQEDMRQRIITLETKSQSDIAEDAGFFETLGNFIGEVGEMPAKVTKESFRIVGKALDSLCGLFG
jgi:energy-coupling factor transporter ATP-binding protein EcfA2